MGQAIEMGWTKMARLMRQATRMAMCIIVRVVLVEV